MSLADAPAGEDDLVAGLVVGRCGRDDRPREVDSGDHRVRAHNPALPPHGEAILVVEAGVGDSDGHVAVRERIARHLFQHGARGAVFLVEDEGPEAVLLHAHDPLS